ncbi:MAG: SLBB domain-containing protein [Gammaproteobacteria bacterium]|nr:SLBB domain-containing protein [Gammaproteobacteria bacterium]
MSRILLALSLLGLLGYEHAAVAQSAGDPVSSALQAFGALSPDQQQALLQQVSGQGSAAGPGSVAGQGAQSNARARAEALAQAQSMGRRAPLAATEDLLPHRLKADDTFIIQLSIRRQKLEWPPGANLDANAPVPAAAAQPKLAPEIELTTKERLKIDATRKLIAAKNPYQLDAVGALQMPGFPAITLAGLTEEQAAQRLAIEPELQKLDVKITWLPVQRPGAGLKHFGYDLFEQAPSTFAPGTDVPVPGDYAIGPGDLLLVQLYGSQNRTLRLSVGRDGHLAFPELGPIQVAGRPFSAVKAELEARVSRQMIGVRASVSMGDTRAMQVFVLGEAKYPGSYTVSGLATMTGALFAAGGVSEIGSLRHIQLKRAGKLVDELDLYDLLLEGDAAHDVKLQAGDVVFIPALGPTVTVDGEVQRPAIYELNGEVTATTMVRMAGGFTADADPGKAALSRVDAQRRRVVRDLDLAGAADGALPLQNADVLRVTRLKPTLDEGVTVSGQVYRPGSYAWEPGLTLSRVLPSLDELMSDADPHYVLVRRVDPATKRISVVSADLSAALAAPGSAADLPLQARDRLTIFDLNANRETVVRPLMEELQLQATQEHPLAVANISGSIKAPGDFPLEPGMRVADLIRAGGGLDTAAYNGAAELSRYVIENGQTRRTQVLSIDLPAVQRGEAAANLELQPFDRLYIKEVSGWQDQDQISLKGEVHFPGTYPIKRGESLRSVIERAGGLTDQAFIEGSVFMRKDLKVREQEQLDRLAQRLQNDLAAATMMAARGGQQGAGQAYSVGQTLLSQIKAAKAVGRLVINLKLAITAPPGSPEEVLVRDGDELVIPKRNQEITIIGEVQNATSHLFDPALSRDDYIALSGGTTRQADLKKVYVVHADGSVDATNVRWWLPHVGSTPIRAGDTVVVPMNAERMPLLPIWQSASTIFYNLVVARAAIRTF